DEHGLKMAQAAESQGLTPKDWADRTSERFREAWKELRISNDDFIRTTEPRHYRAVTEMLQKVYDNGDIELGTYDGLYFRPCTAPDCCTDEESFARWWPLDCRPAGKAILRSHDGFWPARLMAAGSTPPTCAFRHGWRLVGGEQMSKTRLNQIATCDLVTTSGS